MPEDPAVQDIGASFNLGLEHLHLSVGVSLPELLSSLSNYCLTRRRAQRTPTLQHPPTVAPTPWLASRTAPSPPEA